MGMPSDSAATIAPPVTKTTTALVAATASSAVATGADNKEYWITVISSTPFDITFSANGTSTITDPTNTGVFSAGVPYSFCLNSKNSHYKIIGTANGFAVHWRSSRT